MSDHTRINVSNDLGFWLWCCVLTLFTLNASGTKVDLLDVLILYILKLTESLG